MSTDITSRELFETCVDFLGCKTECDRYGYECAGFTLELTQVTSAYECILVGRGYGLVADEVEKVHTFL